MIMPRWSITQKAATVVLVAACVGLAAIGYNEVTKEADTPMAVDLGGRPTSPRAAPEEMIGQIPMPSLAKFSEVSERPLFSPSRRPRARATREVAKPWSSLALKGIIVSHDVREALLRHGTSPEEIQLQEGQSIDGWKILSIGARNVVIESDGVRHELLLPGAGYGGSGTTMPSVGKR